MSASSPRVRTAFDRSARWLAVAGFALTVSSCLTYEYEEEFFLNVDGSGRLRVSGSRELLAALDPAFEASLDEIEKKFSGPAFDVQSVRETSNDGRSFVHIQGSFSGWDELCGTWWYRERDCALTKTEDTVGIRVAAGGRGSLPKGVTPDAPVALRFHFPSAVRFHNSGTDIERGNILRWERSASDLFDAELVAEARFEKRSVLRTTVVILGTAVAIVVVSAASALFWVYRKGRRQLAQDTVASDA